MEHKVLFVDDEEDVLHALQHLTIDEPWEVLIAHSGADALGILETTSVSIVVTDYRMPEMTGVELLGHVRERHPLTVRMVLSGYAEAHAVVAAINEGSVDRFISKPWNDEELMEWIRVGLSKYQLAMENQDLRESLRTKNDELLYANKTLELKVTERTAELEMRNHALVLAQETVDHLPYAVFGIDCNKSLIITNDHGRNFPGSMASSQIGEPVDEWLPPAALAVVETVLANGGPHSATFSHHGIVVCADCEPMGGNASRGAILVLRKTS